jgi:hypothetical protein
MRPINLGSYPRFQDPAAFPDVNDVLLEDTRVLFHLKWEIGG